MMRLVSAKRQGLLVAPLPACELPTARDWSGANAATAASEEAGAQAEPRKARFLRNQSGAKSRLKKNIKMRIIV